MRTKRVNNADREKELSESGRGYFDYDSSVTSVEQFAATMAGAMTIPIKARAIKKSCMIEVPIRRSAEFGTQPVEAPLAQSPLSNEEAPQRESPRLKLMPKNH